ncbi:TonB-dependent receptor [soil metagenome]
MIRFAPAALLLVPIPVQAQEVPDVVVVGRGLPVPPGDKAYDVVTIDAARLSESASGRLEDSLRDVAGLSQFRRSDARSANPTSQGVTLRGLGGNASSRALLLLDGVPQADPFGGWIAWPALLPERIARARVTRGGGSGYSGPGALAGTIDLDSAGPGEIGTIGLDAAYGSRDSIDLSGIGAARLGEGFATLAGSYARGDGFAPIVAEDRGAVDRAAPYEQASVAARAVVRSGTTELQASLSGFTDRRDRGTAFSAIRSEGADASVRLVGRGAWGWSVLGYLQTRSLANQFASINAARSTAIQSLDQYNTPATGVGGRIELAPPIGAGLTLRIGGDVRRVSGETEELFTYVAALPTRRREAGGESVTLGAFVDLSAELGEVTLSLGARADRWSIGNGRLIEYPIAGGAAITNAHFADRAGWEPTGRAGIAWAATPAVSLRVAGYRGWRLPTLNELYRPFRAGADATAANAALSPERLSGVEAGFDLTPLAGLSLRATAFWNRLDNAISNVTLGTGAGTFPGVGFVAAGGAYRQRINLDAVLAKGVEFDARYHVGAWNIAASYSHADSKVEGSGLSAALDGLRPAQTARDQASGTLGWHRGAAGASVTARYTGAQFEDDQNLRRLAPATTFDAQVRLPLGEALSVQLRAENIADARVEAGNSGANIVERASPRTVWFGVGYRLR